MKLKHVATFRAGGTPTVDDPEMWTDVGGMPWVSISDMSGSDLVTATERQLTPAGVASKRLAPAPQGTVLFAMYASVGAVSTLTIPAVWNQALIGVLPIPHQADSRFIAYWLRHLKSVAVSEARSATQANLNAQQVGNLPFPSTSVFDQRRIADFLDDRVSRIDSIIAARHRQGRALRESEQSVLSDLLSARWDESAELRRLRVGVTTGPFGTALAASEYVTGGTPLVSPSNIRGGRIVPDENHAVDLQTARRLMRHRLNVGDLVVSRKGDLGRTAMVTSTEDGWICGSDSIAISSAGSNCDPTFLDLYLKIDSTRAQLLARSNAVTMPSLNEDNLLSLVVPAISLDEQKRRAEQASRLRERTTRVLAVLDASIELLAEYKGSLITAAVTGQFDVTTASTDVPA